VNVSPLYLAGKALLVNDKQRELLAAFDAAATTDAGTRPFILFARRLLRERDLDGCHFPHQHFALAISRSLPGDSAYKPTLRVSSRVGSDDVWLDLNVCAQVAPVGRWIKETAICPPDRAMTEFDHLYERFLKAAKTSPSGGEV
jgi:hypothetical protein